MKTSRTKYSVFDVWAWGPIECHWSGIVREKMKTTRIKPTPITSTDHYIESHYIESHYIESHYAESH